jgi:hypothetical protein
LGKAYRINGAGITKQKEGKEKKAKLVLPDSRLVLTK